MKQKTEIALFGGGCFWCTEAVISVMPGYAGGSEKSPTYEQVCGGRTGHAEVIKVDFDPSQISYRDLLTVFFATHDPTTLNRQGNDVGTQYRSIVLYANEEQKREAEAFIKELNDSPASAETWNAISFSAAEGYHRKYFANNAYQPYCQFLITPKLQKLHKQFAELLKSHGTIK